MRRQDFCLAHFWSVEFGCGNMSDLGGFLQFFVLVQCTQHKGICEYQKICNCNNFLGEMVHYLTEVQRRQEATRLLTMAVEAKNKIKFLLYESVISCPSGPFEWWLRLLELENSTCLFLKTGERLLFRQSICSETEKKQCKQCLSSRRAW